MDTIQEVVTFVRSPEMQKNFDLSNIESFLSWNFISSTKELMAFTIRHCARRTLPYGIWTCEDGREVIFNREYQPILQKKDGVTSYADRNEWVNNICKVQYLYDDAVSPIDFLVKHLGQMNLTQKETTACKKSLKICLQVLRKYTPKEHSSVNHAWSVAEQR